MYYAERSSLYNKNHITKQQKPYNIIIKTISHNINNSTLHPYNYIISRYSFILQSIHRPLIPCNHSLILSSIDILLLLSHHIIIIIISANQSISIYYDIIPIYLLWYAAWYIIVFLYELYPIILIWLYHSMISYHHSLIYHYSILYYHYMIFLLVNLYNRTTLKLCKINNKLYNQYTISIIIRLYLCTISTNPTDIALIC